MRASAPAVLFAVLCLFWGSNWVVLKLALADAPPFALAAARALLAGSLMVAIAGPRTAVDLLRAAPGRVLAAIVNSALILDERLGAREVMGGAILLAAAALVLPPRKAAPRPPIDEPTP